jgi:hypothetical protein
VWPGEVVNETDSAKQVQAKEQALKILSPIAPKADDHKENAQVLQGQYVLWGELFEKGRVVALVALEPGDQTGLVNASAGPPTVLTLAHWNSGRWQVEQIINISLSVSWKSPSISDDERQFLPKNLPDKPFWIRTLGPSRNTMLVISTAYIRDRSACFILMYDPKSHRLDTVEHFSVEEPVWRSGYIVLTGSSGRKAWWTEEFFFQPEDHRLKLRGGLRRGCYNGDDDFIHVTFPDTGNAERTKWRFVSTFEDQSHYKVYVGEEDAPDPQVLGEVRFLSADFEDRGSHLLQKLTNIPAAVATRENWKDGQLTLLPGRVIPDREIKVKGSPELVRLLAPPKRK